MDANASPWFGRRVLVTGCTGFLGGAVTRELFRRGAKVVGLVRDRARAAQFAREISLGQFHLVPGRVEDATRLSAAMAVHEVSAVFHLASGDAGADAVLRAAGAYHSRVAVVTARPQFQFRLAGAEGPSRNPVGVARFGELFGPRDRNLARVVPRSALALLAGAPAPASPGSSRDFVFVRDAAGACLALAEEVGRQLRSLDVTFRSGWEFTDGAMAAIVADAFARRSVGVPPDSSNDEIKWRPETPLADALAETIDWYRQLVTSQADPTAARDLRKAA
jgi:nucleoside-diphosphate-sugar epimerase